MKKLFRKFVFGDMVISEYSTVRIDSGIQERAYLWIEPAELTLDISSCHWLLCLDPIVFGVWIGKEQAGAIEEEATYKIIFRDRACAKDDDPKRKAVAILQMDLVDKIDEVGGFLYLFRLADCRIHHVSFIKSRLLYLKYYKRPGLSFYKLKSFAAAYSYPRKVRVISFMSGDYYNIFPMDLLGIVPGAGRFVFGLRHTNLALARIIEARKIVVSEVPFKYKDIIYQLGSHHSTNPPPIEKLPFNVVRSPEFRFWIPEWAQSCKEVTILKTKDLGSHMLLIGEWTKDTILNPPTSNLYHIHFLHFLHQIKKGNPYPLV
jgi:hypothetical protein